MTTIDRLRHPSISEAVTRAAGIDPEPIPSRGVTRWTAQARQDRPGPLAARPGREGYPGRFWLMGEQWVTVVGSIPACAGKPRWS